MECLGVRIHTVEGLTLGCSTYKALGLACSMISDQALWIPASRACRDQGLGLAIRTWHVGKLSSNPKLCLQTFMYIYIYMVYTLRPKGLPHSCFKAQVYTVRLHGPFGFVLEACRETASEILVLGQAPGRKLLQCSLSLEGFKKMRICSIVRRLIQKTQAHGHTLSHNPNSEQRSLQFENSMSLQRLE